MYIDLIEVSFFQKVNLLPKNSATIDLFFFIHVNQFLGIRPEISKTPNTNYSTAQAWRVVAARDLGTLWTLAFHLPSFLRKSQVS